MEENVLLFSNLFVSVLRFLLFSFFCCLFSLSRAPVFLLSKKVFSRRVLRLLSLPHSCCFLSASTMSSLATNATTVDAAVISRAVRGSCPLQTQYEVTASAPIPAERKS